MLLVPRSISDAWSGPPTASFGWGTSAGAPAVKPNLSRWESAGGSNRSIDSSIPIPAALAHKSLGQIEMINLQPFQSSGKRLRCCCFGRDYATVGHSSRGEQLNQGFSPALHSWPFWRFLPMRRREPHACSYRDEFSHQPNRIDTPGSVNVGRLGHGPAPRRDGQDKTPHDRVHRR